MRRIKVTRGGCGVTYADENGTHRHALKLPEHGPFECDDVQAARLVSKKVAVYVDEPGVNPAATAPAKVAGHLDAEHLGTMTNEQLRKLAADMGVDVSACKKKPELVAAIAAVEVETDEGGMDDPDNELPDLGVADPE